MSRQVDDRVVSMEFDNCNIEKNVKTSMSTLERLKQALNFKGASKGLEAVDNASKKVNFSTMSKAVDEIGVKFNAMQIIATTALANITNAAVNAGKQMVEAMTLRPVTTGFQEYETQIGSIQTILSNTRWQNTSLEQVNSALDELNTYADKTIYNFTEMTRNIGTFTAAGVGLEQSVSAIKGIANLAAASGSTSAQASSAMYQLSQALAAGRVSLMDWNSVVNAGMGGKLFQDALIRTSEVMGTGAKAAIETYGSFRESLTQGQWLTSEVLTETLSQIAGAYTDAELLSKGYTQEQVAEIQTLAEDAEGAATNVRTFSQLIDTTMEALGSGWTNTWEILVGDFEEAQALFTDVSKYINDAVTQSAEARNSLLQGWKDAGGRDSLIAGLRAGFEALLALIKPVQEAFTNIFPPITVDTLVDITNKFKDFMESLKISGETADQIRSIFEGVFSAVKMVGNAIGIAIGFITNFTDNASGAFNAVLQFGSEIGNFVKTISESTDPASELGTIVSNLGESFGKAAGEIGEFLSSGISKLGEIINSISPDTINALLASIATGGFLKFLDDVKDTFSGLKTETKSIGEAIGEFVNDITGGFSESVVGLLDSVRGALEAWQQNLKANALLKIAVAVGILAVSVGKLASLDPQALRDSLGAITVLFGELLGSMALFEKVASGMSFGFTGTGGLFVMASSIAVLAAAMKSLGELDRDQITNGVEAIAALSVVMVAAAKALGSGKGIALEGAAQLVILGVAIKLLASVLNDLSSLNSGQIVQGLVSIGVILAELTVFSNVKKGKDLLSTASSMILLGAALKILAGVVNDLGSLDTGKAIQGIVSIGAVLGEIAAFSHLVDGKKLLQSFLPLMGVTGALYTVAHAIDQIGSLGLEGASVGVAALGAAMTEIVLFTKMLPDEKRLNQISASFPLMAASLVIIAASLKMLSGLSIESVGSALAGFAGSLTILAVAVRAMSGQAKGAGVLILVSTALTILAAAIDLMAVSGLAGVVVGLTALVGVLTVLGVASKLIAPAAPALLSLAGSVAAFGGALVAVAVGSTAIALGLAVSITAIAGALMNLQGSLKELDPATTAVALGGVVVGFVALGAASKVLAPLIPTMLSLSISVASFGLSCAAVAASIWILVSAFAILGDMGTESIQTAFDNMSTILSGFIELIPQAMTGLIEALKSMFLAAFEAIAEVAPSLADSIFKIITEVLQSLNSYGPQIIDFILTFLIQLIDGVAARIPELVGSIANLLDALFTSIFDALSGWDDSGDALNGALGFFAGATALIIALNAIKGMIPGAMQGAAMMTAFIIEVGAILTALGALQQLTGASEFINSAGDLLQSIGTAIGQLIGGIVGGVAEGVTSTLPDVGTNLSQFAMNLTPFLMAMSMVDQGIIDAVTNLTTAIATLVGANLVDSLTSFFTGGTDFSSLGEKLVSFGEAIVEFSNTVQGIDVESVSAAAACGTALAQLAESLPKEGGLVQAIFGETTDMASFGEKLKSFGKALVEYANQVADLDVESISTSVQAGQALSDLASALPDSGGLAEWIFGGSDLGSFGEQLKSFGKALADYATSIANVDFMLIQRSVNNINNLKNALTGFVDFDTSGVENLSVLGDIGDAIAEYYAAVSEYDVASLGQSITSLYSLRDFISSLTGVDTSGIASFSNALTQLGQVSLDGLISVFSNASLSSVGQNLATTFTSGFASGMASANAAISSAVSSITSVLNSKNQAFNTSGGLAASAYASGIQNGVSSVTTAVTNMVESASSALGDNYQSFYDAGGYLAEGFANGISGSAYAAATAARAMANAAVRAAQEALAEHSPSKVMQHIGEYAGLGFVNGVEAYVPESEKVGTDMASAIVSGISVLDKMLASDEVISSITESLSKLSSSLSSAQEQTAETTEATTDNAQNLSSVISTLTNSLQEVTKRKKDLKAMSSIMKRTGVTFTKSFVDEILSSSGQFAGALTEMGELTDEQLQVMVDAFSKSKIYENVNALIDAFGEDEGLIGALAASGRSIEEFAADVSSFGVDVDTIANKISEFSSKVSDGFNKMELDGQTTLEEFTKNLENNYRVAQEWQQNLKTVFDKVGDFDLADKFRKELLEGGFEKYGQIVADLAAMSAYEIREFLTMWDYVQRSADNMSGQITSTLIPDTSRFVSTGEDISSGLAKGIENGTEEVTGAMETLCVNIEEEVKSYFGIASPSKLMRRIGRFVTLGFAKGVSDDAKTVDDSIGLICSSVMDAVNSISDSDMEFHPRVVPVVDSTEAMNKLAMLNSGLVNTPSSYVMNTVDSISRYGQNGDLGSRGTIMALEDAVTRLTNKVDSIDPENFGITYQQNNYSPKTLSTAEIYRKTKSQLSRIKSKNSNGGILLR